MVFVAVGIALLVAFVLAFTGLQAITGWGLAFVITAVAAVVAYLLIVLRLGLAPVMLLWGAGPIESIGRSWRLTEGHLARVFRWLIVTALIIGVVSSVLGGMVGAIFGSVGLAALAQVVAAGIAAPFSLVYTTVFILLARLLTSPDAPQPPSAAVLPDWMQQTSPATPDRATDAGSATDARRHRRLHRRPRRPDGATGADRYPCGSLATSAAASLIEPAVSASTGIVLTSSAPAILASTAGASTAVTSARHPGRSGRDHGRELLLDVDPMGEVAGLACRRSHGPEGGRARQDRWREDDPGDHATDDAPLEAGLRAVLGHLLDVDPTVGIRP